MTWTLQPPGADYITQLAPQLQIKNPNLVGGYTAGSFHPDGTILGMGTSSNLVKMWEFKANKVSHSPGPLCRSLCCRAAICHAHLSHACR